MTDDSTRFRLLETMRWERGIWLLNRHMYRLRTSADTLGFSFDEAKVRDNLAQHEASFDDQCARRVRLTLDRDGSTYVTHGLIDQDRAAFRTAIILPYRVSSAEELRSFKTTQRLSYETPYQMAKAGGYDEAILVNERNEVVEGTRTNVWARRDGQWLTPPLESGCVGGVYRAHMLAIWEDASERVLTLDDLTNADKVGLSNAVYGFLPVEVAAKP